MFKSKFLCFSHIHIKISNLKNILKYDTSHNVSICSVINIEVWDVTFSVVVNMAYYLFYIIFQF